MKIKSAFSTSLALRRLISSESLSSSVSFNLTTDLLNGLIPDRSAKALLTLITAKGETSEELIGAYRAVRKKEPVYNLRIPQLIDTCGTGGDGAHTFNISTAAAFIAAGAGAKIAKHGNRALTSKCGSSDLIEALDIPLEASPKAMFRSIRKWGIGYFHAPLYHPAFKRVQPLRKQIKCRTLFNSLGPLLNPVRLSGQLVGVGNSRIFDLYVGFYKLQKNANVLICQSMDGMDEISTACQTKYARIVHGQSHSGQIDPRKLGLKLARKNDYLGGSAHENKDVFLKLIQGSLKGPIKDICLLNAAAALWVANVSNSIEDGLFKARHSLESGGAYLSYLGLLNESSESRK